jgi:hypothetical protein
MELRRILVVLVALLVMPACSAQARVNGAQRTFPVYDNMFYRGKPDTTREGLVGSNILYESEIWPRGKDYGVLPERSEFEALVRSHVANPGPLVLDIEKLPLSGSDARKHLEVLATLADWAHHAVPHRIIGYYGTNTIPQVAPNSDRAYAIELTRHVDAFFPSMYTFDDDRVKWAARGQEMAKEAHDLDPHKPVYFYLWPQYHDNTPKQFQLIDAAYWKFQLETTCHESNGMVLWGPSKFDWDDTTGWWQATRRFVHALHVDNGRCTGAG